MKQAASWPQFATALRADQLRSLLPQSFFDLFQTGVERIDAHEGAIWIHHPEQNALVAGYITHPDSAVLEGTLSQDLESGLISRAFRENTTIHEEGLFRPRTQSKAVDQQLKQVTQHQIAVPFPLEGGTKGVVSVVQISDGTHAAPSHWGLRPRTVSSLSASRRPSAPPSSFRGGARSEPQLPSHAPVSKAAGFRRIAGNRFRNPSGSCL